MKKEKELQKLLIKWNKNHSYVDQLIGKYGFNLNTLYNHYNNIKIKNKYKEDLITKDMLEEDFGPMEWMNASYSMLICHLMCNIYNDFTFFGNVSEEIVAPCVLNIKNILMAMPRAKLTYTWESHFNKFFGMMNIHITNKNRTDQEIENYCNWYDNDYDPEDFNQKFNLLFN